MISTDTTAFNDYLEENVKLNRQNDITNLLKPGTYFDPLLDQEPDNTFTDRLEEKRSNMLVVPHRTISKSKYKSPRSSDRPTSETSAARKVKGKSLKLKPKSKSKGARL
jgi:hypothetical protein